MVLAHEERGIHCLARSQLNWLGDAINTVLQTIPRSGIRRITDKVLELNHAENHIIQLSLGQPQEPTPDLICRALADAALTGFTKYTLNAGMLELRSALKQKLALSNNIWVEVNDIFIVPGATYGVTVGIGAIINPGDEVLVPDPGYPNYAPAVLHYGGTVKFYQLQAERGFQIDLQCLKSLVTDRTKLIVINSPSNPTGSVLTKSQVEDLVEYAARRGIWLLSDEVYEAYVYSGEHISPLSVAGADRVVGVYSFSKTYNMAGLRVGYLVTGHSCLHASLINAQELYISCAPSVSQIAAMHALMYCGKDVESLKGKFHRKRDMAMAILGDFVPYTPQGAFYILVDISRTGLTSDQFADALLREKQVAVAPSATFGPSADRYIRIAVMPEVEELETGLRSIREFIEERVPGKGIRPSQPS